MDFIIQKIKHLQEQKKVSVKDLAKAISVTRQSIYDYYNGKTNLSINTLQKIAHYFGVPVSYFFDEGAGTVINGTGNIISNSSNVNITIDRQQHEIARLKELLKEKDAQLSEKDKRINTLEHLIKVLEEKCK